MLPPQELFMQGDRERALGQPVSALMDRSKPGIQKSQVSIALGPKTAASPTVQWQQAMHCTRPSNSSADSFAWMPCFADTRRLHHAANSVASSPWWRAPCSSHLLTLSPTPSRWWSTWRQTWRYGAVQRLRHRGALAAARSSNSTSAVPTWYTTLQPSA